MPRGSERGRNPHFPLDHENNSKATFNHQRSEWETLQPLGSLGLLGFVYLLATHLVLATSHCSPLLQFNLSSPTLMSLSQLSPFQSLSSPGRETKGFTPSPWAHSCLANSSSSRETGCSPLRNHNSASFTGEDRSILACGVQPRHMLQA